MLHEGVDVNPTVALVLSRLSMEPQTIYEIAEQVCYHPETVSRILRRALGGHIVRDTLSRHPKRWVYGWRLRCKGCGK